MKATKKLFALVLALVMAMALSVSASAATITINGAVSGETYTAYKLFDVSVTADGEGYSYYTTSEALVDALEDADLGLTFTKAQSQEVWYVSGLTDSDDAADLAEYIHDNWTTYSSLLDDGVDAKWDDNTATIDVDDAVGYYYVTSSLGSLCALNTATETATVNEKNTVPSIKKEVKEDSTDEYGDSATIDVTDTVSYKLTVNTGTNSANLGTGIDGDYTITDTLPDGFTYDEEAGVAVSVGNDTWALYNAETQTGDYTVNWDENENTLTITLLASKLKTLAQNANIVITYDADVDGDEVVIGGTGNINTVELEYKEQSSTASATVYTYEIGSAGNFKKVDGSGTALSGVTFVLTKVDNGTTYYAEVTNGYLTGWKTEEEISDNEEYTGNIDILTDANGNISVKGLDAGTYTLTETATLDGYNLLADTITVVIAEDGTVSYYLTSVGPSEDEEDDATITVVNTTGSLLPSTGGMGTTVIYIVGALLVIGAGVVLVVRRRMSAE